MAQLSDEWELVAANEVHVVDGLKQEGNALFQQQRFFDAIQVYANALAHIPPIDTARLTRNDVENLEQLEVAVRLNRALAYIELRDTTLLAYAEEDCSVVLARQPNCVKALYRRALARERLGKIKDALSDTEQMCALEPANPAGLQLMARLEEAWSSECVVVCAVESELSVALKQQCTVTAQTRPKTSKAKAIHETSVLDAWKSLQDEEEHLRGEFLKPPTQFTGITKCSRTKTNHQTSRKQVDRAEQVGNRGEEVRAKTDSIWAALVEEETSTVGRFYKKRTGGTTRNATTGKLTTSSAASIHPSR